MKKAILSLALILTGVCFAQDGSFSPFETPSAKPNGPVQEEEPPSSLDNFQFNGIMTMGGKTRVSVFDAKEKRNFWLVEGEQGEMGLAVQSIGSGGDSVVITQNGRSKTLTMNEVKIEELKFSQPMPAQVQPPQPSTTVARPQPERIETDEEARARIQRVAEEIRRRRAERRKRLEERAQESN